MKTVPLLLFGGLIKEDSFYFENNGILKVKPNPLFQNLRGVSGKLEELVGTPLSVELKILEGENSYGTVEHRNISLIDTSKGGGMLQDLGHHALTPILALQTYLGKIDLGSVKGLRKAFCDEYLEKEKTRVNEALMGESYAEIDLLTQRNVPIKIALGKYVENGANRREITIKGTNGIILYDLTENILSYQKKDTNAETHSLVEADKIGNPKYLAVLMAGIDYVSGKNPFVFNPVSIACDAQNFILNLLSRQPDAMGSYSRGEYHQNIF